MRGHGASPLGDPGNRKGTGQRQDPTPPLPGLCTSGRVTSILMSATLEGNTMKKTAGCGLSQLEYSPPWGIQDRKR